MDGRFDDCCPMASALSEREWKDWSPSSFNTRSGGHKRHPCLPSPSHQLITWCTVPERADSYMLYERQFPHQSYTAKLIGRICYAIATNRS